MILLECKLTRGGIEYKGTKAVTKSGKLCRSWRHYYLTDEVAKNVFPDATVEDAENFCRNPGAIKFYGPWCFTSIDAEKKHWEYCTIPHCDYTSLSTGKKKEHAQLCCKHELNG